MAEASFNNPGSPICQYFLNSTCRYGDQCRFRHPLPTHPRPGMCKFYLRGICRFGDNCWNRHAPDDAGGPPKGSRGPPPSSSGPFPNPLQQQSSRDQQSIPAVPISEPNPPLCADFIAGRCAAGYACDLMHGDACPSCGLPCLDPLDPGQRARHEASCDADARAQRDATNAQRRGLDKTCGICLDVVREKADPTARKFGVLENCDHVFCFECIMRWRKVKNRDVESFADASSAGKACPECRTPSDFVAPSKFWFATPEEKRKLVSDRRAYLGSKHCRAFRRGEGHCPFGSHCYNLHVLHNGQKVSLPPPSPFPGGDLDFVSRLLLLDFWGDDLFSSDSDLEDDDLDLLYNLDFEIMNRLEF